MPLMPASASEWHAPAVAVFLFSDETVAFSDALNQAAPWLATSPALNDFLPDEGECVLVHAPSAAPIPRIALAGMGARPATTEERLDAVRKAAGNLFRFCQKHALDEVAFSLPDLYALDTKHSALLLREGVCGALLGVYQQAAHKSGRNGMPKQSPQLRLLSEHPLSDEEQKAFDCAVVSADAVIFAKDLINGPANIVTPSYLAARAQEIAAGCPNMTCRELDKSALKELGMGAFLAVAAGAREEPRLVVLDYAPAGHENDKPLVLVGKGLTFDSGGLCLKPASSMNTMKEDMSGAAAVLAVFKALAALDAPCRVTALLPCTENMPGEAATRPGDVVTTLSGCTVEITNTDAEGRLVLCDALTYAQKLWKPRAIIDIATLTGACIVALGKDVAGVFSQDPLLPEQIMDAGRTVGERFWPLPLWDMYFRNLKSDVADFTNCGAREGGASTAAAFLARFVEPHVRWVHLDIAGPAFTENNKKEARGFAVRTLLDLALQSGQNEPA